MVMSEANLGLDWTGLYQSAKTAGIDLVTNALPNAVEKTVAQKVQTVATPVVQQLVQQKANEAAVKGKMALWASVGGGVGILMGALIAGGSWKRRATGGAVAGAALAGAGAFASFKIGLLMD